MGTWSRSYWYIYQGRCPLVRIYTIFCWYIYVCILYLKTWHSKNCEIYEVLRFSHEGDKSCFEDPSTGGPYGDFGWWSQYNGYQCSNDSKDSQDSHYREYCYKLTTSENNTIETQFMNNTNLCNWPRGTDGQQFHPYIEKEERLWIFQTDICRSLYMDFQVLRD